MAGGPYGCFPNYYNKKFPNTCGANGSTAYRIDVDNLIKYAEAYASKGLIDPISNLKDTKVWVESVTMDMLVNERVVAKVADFYRAAGVPENKITVENKTVSAHAF